MTHIPGHIDGPNNSFGVLKPVYIKETGLESSTASLLFAPPSVDSVSRKELVDNDSQLTKDHLVAFHPYIVPWGARNQGGLIIASDLAEWEDHVNAEEIVKAGMTGAKVDIEQLNDDPGLDIIRKARGKIRTPTGASARMRDANEAMKSVLDRTVEYIQTTSFQTIYLKGKPRQKKGRVKAQGTNKNIEWIENYAVPLDDIGFEVKNHIIQYLARRNEKR